jgi:hypothetical protein
MKPASSARARRPCATLPEVKNKAELVVLAANARIGEELKKVAKAKPGILDPSQKLAKKRYTWLAENYPDASTEIEKIKDAPRPSSTSRTPPARSRFSRYAARS